MRKLGKKITELNEKIPFILIGVILGSLIYTLGEMFHWHFHHGLHNEQLHFTSNHRGMWLFFALLGAEITLKALKQAGKTIGLATIGGMIVPPAAVYIMLTLGNSFNLIHLDQASIVAISLGAMATDVAFSVAASDIAKTAKFTLIAMISGLLILAVGDDLGGVIILAGVYAESIDTNWLVGGLGLIALTYFIGEKGEFSRKKEAHYEDGRIVKWIEKETIQVNNILIWWSFAIINTFILYQAGVEWILGACLTFIFAPEHVKHSIERLLQPIIPFVLLLFGLVNGAINIASPESWGFVTLAAFAGGMGGKRIGIFLMAILGKFWTKKTEPENKYGYISNKSLYSLSLFGSVNGTVAIFFVSIAASKGIISEVIAIQAILGYFLTVPAVMIETIMLKKFNFFEQEEPEVLMKKELN